MHLPCLNDRFGSAGVVQGMKITPLVLSLALLACGASRPPAKPADLASFARDSLLLSSFRTARVDLNDDAQPETILYATDQSFCGTGGCTLFVLSPTKSSFQLVGKTPAIRLPVGVVPTSHNGWRDLAVTVSGGATVEPYLVRLTHDGISYPASAFGPSIARLDGIDGELLLAPLTR